MGTRSVPLNRRRAGSDPTLVDGVAVRERRGRGAKVYRVTLMGQMLGWGCGADDGGCNVPFAEEKRTGVDGPCAGMCRVELFFLGQFNGRCN